MSLVQYVQQNPQHFVIGGLTLLLGLSEWLGTNDKYKSNSIFQLIQNFLKAKLGKS